MSEPFGLPFQTSDTWAKHKLTDHYIEAAGCRGLGVDVSACLRTQTRLRLPRFAEQDCDRLLVRVSLAQRV